MEPIHRAAFEGDLEAIERSLAEDKVLLEAPLRFLMDVRGHGANGSV